MRIKVCTQILSKLPELRDVVRETVLKIAEKSLAIFYNTQNPSLQHAKSIHAVYAVQVMSYEKLVLLCIYNPLLQSNGKIKMVQIQYFGEEILQ